VQMRYVRMSFCRCSVMPPGIFIGSGGARPESSTRTTPPAERTALCGRFPGLSGSRRSQHEHASSTNARAPASADGCARLAYARCGRFL
jgi:hypothetical protein